MLPLMPPWMVFSLQASELSSPSRVLSVSQKWMNSNYVILGGQSLLTLPNSFKKPNPVISSILPSVQGCNKSSTVLQLHPIAKIHLEVQLGSSKGCNNSLSPCLSAAINACLLDFFTKMRASSLSQLIKINGN